MHWGTTTLPGNVDAYDRHRMVAAAAARRVAGQSLLAVFALAAVTLGCAWRQPAEPQLTTAALLYLVIVVLLSLNGSFTAAITVSIIAVVFLQPASLLRGLFLTRPL